MIRVAASLIAWLVAVLTAVTAGPARAEDAELWAALKSRSAFAIMRHALAPGTGDPPGFAIGDCSTQRNLSEAGREQARAIGQRFRANGITSARVVTSQWCRCRDTATELGFGAIEELAALNSFFGSYEQRGPQTNALEAWLRAAPRDAPLVLVTHQVNISALTGRSTRSGEVVVVRWAADGRFEAMGSL